MGDWCLPDAHLPPHCLGPQGCPYSQSSAAHALELLLQQGQEAMATPPKAAKEVTSHERRFNPGVATPVIMQAGVRWSV